MIKLCLILCVVVCCFLIGYKIGDYYRKRKTFYKEVLKFLNTCISHVKYSHEKVCDIVKKEKEHSNKKFEEILNLYLLYLNNKIDKRDFLEELKKNLYFLNNKEIEELFVFFISFGLSNEEGEYDRALFYEKIISERFSEAEKESKKLFPLYCKFGLIAGSLFFIIFI